jgi:hypothetical protein
MNNREATRHTLIVEMAQFTSSATYFDHIIRTPAKRVTREISGTGVKVST